MILMLLSAILVMGTCFPLPSSGLVAGGMERDVLAGHTHNFDLGDALRPFFLSFPELDYDAWTDDPGFFLIEPMVFAEGVLYFRVEDGLPSGTQATVFVEAMGDEGFYLLTVLLTVVSDLTAEVDISSITIDKSVYDGEAVLPAGTAKVTLNGLAVVPANLTYTYTGRDGTPHPDPAVPPADAGSYRLVIGVEGGDYRGTSAPLDFTIAKRPLTITPVGISILAGDPLPGSYDCEFEGLAREEDQALFGPVVLPEHTDSGAAGVIRLYIANADTLTHRNYEVRCADGAVTVQGSLSLTPDHYTVPEPGESGWYNCDVILTAAGLDGFDEIARSADGPFAASTVLTEEGEEVEAILFLRQGAYVAQIPFLYSLDKTSPVLEVEFTASTALTGARLTVTASDALSGISGISVTDPFGGELAGHAGVYPVDTEGSYTVTATDYAGNSTELIRHVDLSGDTGGWTESTGGIVLLDGVGNWSGGAVNRSARRSSSGRSGGGEADGDGEETASAETRYWERVTESLRKAEEGAGVSIAPRKYLTVPASVLNALRGRDVTLRIITQNGSILLYGKKIPQPEQEFYSLEELAALVSNDSRSPQEPVTQTAAVTAVGSREPEPAVQEEPQPAPVPVTTDSRTQNSPRREAWEPAAILQTDAVSATRKRPDVLGVVTAVLLGAAALGVTGLALVPVRRIRVLGGEPPREPPGEEPSAR